MMKIGGLQKTTLIDFPGCIAATVFLAGCNFRCPFCYSGELVLPERKKQHLKIAEKEFFSFLEERKGLLDGVTICGGEPCINNDLPRFCRKIKKRGYLVKLDTNGSFPDMLEKLISEKLVDYVAMDIKAPLGLKIQNPKSKIQKKPKTQISKYDEAAGVKVNLNNIKKSIEIIKNSGIDYEFRSTIVPSLHTRDDVIEMAKWIRGAKKYYLQNFRPEKTIDPDLEKIAPYSQEYILALHKAISPLFEICRVR